MYSVCYVLSDNENLEYYSEMIISICSLRKRKYQGEIFLLLDENTLKIISKYKQMEYEQFNIKTIVVDVPETFSTKMKSRYIKTSIRKRIEGDFLFIDTDTIVAGDLPNIVSQYDFALVKDVHCRLCDMSLASKHYNIEINKTCGYDLVYDQEYYNTGIMWVKDTEMTHKIFERWHHEWNRYALQTSVKDDQPGINKVIVDVGGIHSLPDIFNVQLFSNPFPTHYLAEAKILHYGHKTSSTYMLADKQIRLQGLLNSQIQQIIENPQRAFSSGTIMKKNDVREYLLTSNQYHILEILYTKHSKIFDNGERIARFCLNTWGKIRKCIKK